MTSLSVLIIICASSFLGILALLFQRFYLIKDWDRERIYKGIISASPFFYEFEQKLSPAASLMRKKIFIFVRSRNEFKLLKKYFRKVSDYMNGRHKLTNNGCRGYWDEVNDYKKKDS
jgi:hypothetical protein